MNRKNWLKVARVIREHYQISRPVTVQEVEAEVSNLQRRARPDGPGLDDLDGLLYARIQPFIEEL